MTPTFSIDDITFFRRSPTHVFLDKIRNVHPNRSANEPARESQGRALGSQRSPQGGLTGRFRGVWPGYDVQVRRFFHRQQHVRGGGKSRVNIEAR